MNKTFLRLLTCRVIIVAFVTAASASDVTQLAPVESPVPNSQQADFFEKKIRPLLSEKCFSCHGPDAKSVKGGLRMESRASLLQGGDTGPAITPGNPTESLLIQSVRYEGPYEMPPKGRLREKEIALLETWVRDGAFWPEHETTAPTKSIGFDLQARKATHWFWQPLRNAVVPQVQQTSWMTNSVDAFVLSRLEAAQLSPAVPASRHTLVRRLSFDLLGVPPAIQEVDEVVADSRPNAIEAYVDRLMSSPRFGEHWARHWMDLVRYAETYGHEFDYAVPHAFEYRDYLIRAFNADVSYDDFVREHIAGDLLEVPRIHPSEGFNESILGSAFWWLGEAVHAPTDVLLDEAERLDNMVDVMSKTFLGLTVACARCHDHKFDAISSQDYYSLAGYVQDSRRQFTQVDPQGHVAKTVAHMQEIVRRASDTLRHAYATESTDGADVLRRSLLATRDAMRNGLITLTPEGLPPQPTPGDERSGRILAATSDRYGLSPDSVQRWIAAILSPQIRAGHPLSIWRDALLAEQKATDGQWEVSKFLSAQHAQHEAYQEGYQEYLHDSLPLLEQWRVDTNPLNSSGFAFASGVLRGGWDPLANSPMLRSLSVLDSGRWSAKLVGSWRSPTFILREPRLHYRVAARNGLLRVYVDGYFMSDASRLLFSHTYTDVNTNGAFLSFEQTGNLDKYIGHRVYLEALDRGDGYMAIRDIRQAHRGPIDPPTLAAQVVLKLGTGPAHETMEDLAERLAHLHATTLSDWRNNAINEFQQEWLRDLMQDELISLSSDKRAEMSTLQAEWKHLEDALPPARLALASADGTGLDRPIAIRGNPRTLGAIAPRQLPVAIAGDLQPTAPTDHCGRSELASHLLVDGRHLVARVIVNRLWHHVFGRGIVPTVDNFGVLGQPPTHPELLDYLAHELIRHDWSLKHILRLLVLSQTYQMSSDPCAADANDPANNLWHRTMVRRLPGEAIRDSILAVSGNLRNTMYGPSVPIHVTPFMEGRGKPASGPLNGNGRRSVYVEVRRNFLSPMMLGFDSPIPFSTVGQRSNSNVPAQALILMNDPFVLTESQQWAKHLVRTAATVVDSTPVVASFPSNEAAHLDDSSRIRHLYQQALSRLPTDDEQQVLRTYLHDRRKIYSDMSWATQRIEEQTWEDMCHVMFNVKEFVFLH